MVNLYPLDGFGKDRISGPPLGYGGRWRSYTFRRDLVHDTIADLQSLAADRGYDAKVFRDELRENGIRPLIKHRIMNPLDHAHNGRMDGDRYHQRSMSGTVFSSIKRTLGSAVRARSWWLAFREMLLKVTGYNLRRTVRFS